ncbi:MAG: HAMP domain-containing sensor histidine kinase [Ilumatobacteraceae bacterium]
MSLRARLVATVSLVAFIALGTAGVATYTAYSRSQLTQIDDTLQRSHEPVEQAVAVSRDELDLALSRAAPGLFVALLDPDGATVIRIPAREPGHKPLDADLDDVALPPSSPGDFVDRPYFSTLASTSGDDDIRVRTSRLQNGEVLVLGVSLHEADRSQRSLIAIEAFVAAAAHVLAALFGWVLVRVGLRPLRRVEQTALLIAAGGDLEHEVPGSDRPTEIGRLASALNTMLARIRGAFAERDATERALRSSEEKMRRFVADVSHELRTPLAAVSAYAELFERGARDHPEDLERSLRGITVESARMRELVEELLLLAHLDEGRPLAAGRVDLNEVVVDAISAARAVSPAWPIALRASEVIIVDGDASRLRQVIDNLLGNVRMHTPAGTSTTVELRAGERAIVTVRDDGPGMTTEQAAHVFERFYRVDPSRSRASGGAGLGLAIVDALVRAHHGVITVDAAPGHGVTFTISLPLAAPA